jgi:RNA polymerase sigma factor (sigma-70 family)
MSARTPAREHATDSGATIHRARRLEAAAMSARSFDSESLLRQTDWLRALAATLVGDAGHADDVVQETWVRALERPPRRASDERSLRAWLAKVARNLARSRARSVARVVAREREAARDEARESVADAVERVAAQRELDDAVLSLD